MKSNNISKIENLLEILCLKESFTEKDYNSLIKELKKYYKTLKFNEATNKITLLFILKLSEEEIIPESKYESVKITLDDFLKFSKSGDNSDIIRIIDDDDTFKKINSVFMEFCENNIIYSYLSWKYIKIFGENAKNFQDIYQIAMCEFLKQKYECDFNFPYDEHYFLRVSNQAHITYLSRDEYQNTEQVNDKETGEEKQENIYNEVTIKEENSYFNSNGENNSKYKEENGIINGSNESIKEEIKQIEGNIKDIDLEKEECNNIKEIIKDNKCEDFSVGKKKKKLRRKRMSVLKAKNMKKNSENNNFKYFGDGKEENNINIESSQEIKMENNIKDNDKEENNINNESSQEIKMENNIKDNDKNNNGNSENNYKKTVFFNIENYNEIKIEKKEKENETDPNNNNLCDSDSSNEEENITEDNIKDLKENLSPKENLKQYFQKMFDYYNKNQINMNNFYLFDLVTNNYFDLTNKFIFKKDYDKLPFVSNMFAFLMEQLNSIKNTNNELEYKEYQGEESFGILICEQSEYFYVFKNEFNRNLFNDINNVKEYDLEEMSIDHYSRHSNKFGKEYFDYIDSTNLIGEDFENKINRFIREFNLKELPSYFFKLKTKNNLKEDEEKIENCKENESKSNESKTKPKESQIKFNDIEKKPKENQIKFSENEINMDSVDKYYFSAFIETDGAFIYENPSPLVMFDKSDKKFKVSKTIDISSYGETIKIIRDKGELKIKKNTILLIEDKLKFPDVIDDLERKKVYSKDFLLKSLNFVIYKTIKKIKIYEEYLKSVSNGNNESYSFCLLFIYNSRPISKVERIFKDVLKNLFTEKLIPYEAFQLKIIYLLPCISLNDFGEIKELKNKINKMDKEMKSMKRQLKMMNSKKQKMEEQIEEKVMEKMILLKSSTKKAVESCIDKIFENELKKNSNK